MYENTILKNPKLIFVILLITLLSFGYNSKDFRLICQLADLDPDYADAHYNKGAIHLKNENFTKAIKSFGEVIRLNAGNVDAYLGMGAAYIGSGNGQAAISTYEQVIRLQPKSRNAHYHLFVENKRIGNEKAAQGHLDLLERLDPALAAHAKNQFE